MKTNQHRISPVFIILAASSLWAVSGTGAWCFAQTDECAALLKKTDRQLSTFKLPSNCGERIHIGKEVKNWKYIAAYRELDPVNISYTGPALALWDENRKFVQKIPTTNMDLDIFFGKDSVSFNDDINFDGYKDLRVEMGHGPVDIEIVSYDYWIFDPVAKKFKKDPFLSGIVNPEFDNNKKIIVSAKGFLNLCFKDPDCIGGSTRTYKFNGKSYQNLYDLGNLPKFEDYPAKKTFKGKPASVDFDKNPQAKQFNKTGGPGGANKGLITGETAKGPNFAGHYRFMKWSCGSKCIAVAIVDVSSGEIAYSPFKGDEPNRPNFNPWTKLDYRVDSSLLVVNGKYYDWEPFFSTQIYVAGIKP
jgi:hypothetical protein